MFIGSKHWLLGNFKFRDSPRCVKNNIISRKEVSFWSSFEKSQVWGCSSEVNPLSQIFLIWSLFLQFSTSLSRVVLECLDVKATCMLLAKLMESSFALARPVSAHRRGLRSVLFLLFLLASLFFLLLFLFLSLCRLTMDKDCLHPCKLFPVTKTLFFWLMFLNGFVLFLPPFPDREVFTYSGDEK